MTPKEKAVDFILREYYPLRNKHNNKPNSCWFQSFVEKGINIALQEQSKEIFGNSWLELIGKINFQMQELDNMKAEQINRLLKRFEDLHNPVIKRGEK